MLLQLVVSLVLQQDFLQRHCGECHGTEKPKGDFRIDQVEGHWSQVLEQIQSGSMPPKKKPRPPAIEVAAFLTSIREKEAARRAAQGRVVYRRLNRVEYSNSVSDLLGIQYDFRENLALDGTADGFDNVGAGLHLSSFALERYLEAADRALNLAVCNQPAPKPVKKLSTLASAHSVKIYKDQYFRVLDDSTAVCFMSTHDMRVHLPDFYPQDRGTYRVRISASAYQSEGKPVTFDLTSQTMGLIGYFEVPADIPTEIEVTVRAERQTGMSILPYGLGNACSKAEGKAAKYTGPGLAIHWVEIEGPILSTWPPVSHTALFGGLKQVPTGKWKEKLEAVSDNPDADAERILRAFTRKAFRRPVTDADVAPFLALVRARLAEKDPFEQAVRAGLSAVMTSPGFLFLDEKPGKLDDFALASRLSYFLWSTMPDEELLALAEAKQLAPRLREQVERMLASPKAAAFTRNFCGQWLRLRDIDFTAPHYYLYPEFDPMLKASMVRETELFFDELLKRDLSVANVVASDFSILNGRLARHYGIPGVDGLWEFRKVALPPESHRGGVITMASVLKVTADGTTTSPIKRGAWILDRILGTPPPKPPADVPALEPDIRGAKTIREQLAKHRNDPACASCHAMIDPPGFALESFDVIGGWRDYYRLSNWTKGAKSVKGVLYLQGPDVDPSGEAADGTPFKNIDDFRRMLLRDPDQLARSLAQKIVTYATGGAPEGADRPEIDRIVARVREKKHGLRSLVHEIVQSPLFREK